MAIYHLKAGVVSRSSGRSCVQAAAYLMGEQLHESRRNITADYSNRSSDVVYKITLAPEGAPAWMSTSEIWDRLESFEDAYAHQFFKNEAAREKHLSSAQTAKTFVLALPRELSRESSQELVEAYLKERFISRGLIGTAVIHDEGDGNPHAHLLISRRRYDPKTSSFSKAKFREMDTRYDLVQTRRFWAEMTNAMLEREGQDVRIDHRSYAEQGLDLIPTQHKGWYAYKLESLGATSRIVAENQQIEEVNREKILINPEIILKEVSLRQATFTKTDVAKLIQKRLKDDTDMARAVYAVCESEMIEVGLGINGETRYTTKPYKDYEQTAISHTEKLLEGRSSRVIDQQRLQEQLNTSYGFLNNEQKSAVHLLCQESQLSVLVGRAGAGKTTLMKAIVEAHEGAGYQVIGMSLAAKAAENLELETGCRSETIAYYLDKWDRLKDAEQRYWSLHPTSEHKLIEKTVINLSQHKLTDKHLVIVDEAGMVGTKDWARVLEAVQESCAKLIAVGDDHQFKAIEAGDFFRKLKDKAEHAGRLASLDTIIRQKESWMRDASYQLAHLQTYEALAAYEKKEFIEGGKRNEVIAQLVEDYLQHREDKPGETRLLLAYTREQCNLLNDAVRGKLKDQGWIQAEGHTIGGKEFCIGDQIVFLKNDRDKKISAYDAKTGEVKDVLVKNGTVGKIIGIQEGIFTAELNPQTHVRFNTKDYNEITHGYALTLHKSQGQTVDQTFILASKHMDAYSTYVALTRHRFEAKLYYAREDFVDFKALQMGLGRVQDKDLVIDYHKENLTPQQIRAHDYTILGQDLTTLAQEKEWETFNHFKQERVKIGKKILNAWEDHKEPLRQAGITKESLEIFCGTKARPLSRAEEKAYNLALSYQEKAEEARSLWREIRRTHPGKYCANHERYEAFNTLRQERDQLAHDLISKPALLSLAYKASGGELRVSRKTLEAQSQRHQAVERGELKDVGAQKHSYTNMSYRDQTPGNKSGSLSRSPDIGSSQRHSITPDEVKQQLQHRTADLAKDLFGEPSRKGVREWRYGNKGSVAVFVAGAKQGLYSNFETGTHGGGLQMIQDHMGLDYKDAYKWACEWLGERNRPFTPQRAQPATKTVLEKEKTWVPVFPVPTSVAKPDIQNNPYLSSLAKDRDVTAMYAYNDHKGRLMGYVVRLEDKDGNKITPTLTYCENEKGQQHWRWKGFGDNRPLYNQDKLIQSPTKPVLIVEGEKTADATSKLFPTHVVVTWPGGAGAVEKANWGVLAGRTVTIWPDHDAAGIKAAHHIAEAIQRANSRYRLQADVKTVDLPAALPAKWDLADPLPATLSLNQIRDLVNPSPCQSQRHPYPTKPAYEIEALTFLKHYTDYKLVSYKNDVTAEQKAAFEKHLAVFMKNEKALDYLKMIDPDTAKVAESLRKDQEKIQQLNQTRDFKLTR